MNPAIFRRKFNRIIDKIKKYLFQSISITIDINSPLNMVVQFDLNPFLLRFRPYIKHSFLKNFLQIYHSDDELHLILLELGEVEHFLNKTY
ncbi:hypothetical protein D3C75_1164090 [compost metagenome]